MSQTPAQSPAAAWERYQRHLCHLDALGMSLDISRMAFDDGFFTSMAGKMAQAFSDMEALEAGAIANPDENRRVGHYWLRTPQLAPDPELTQAIRAMHEQVRAFAAGVHSGVVRPEKAERFTHLLVIGIGGSALGPQLIADALGGTRDALEVAFLDNTDPDGFQRVLSRLGPALGSTLTIVISKSGGTKETRNGMHQVRAAYQAQGLRFGAHAAAVTGDGSELHGVASAGRWLAIFPMWDWVGGRTSIMSAVGLLPAALQGLDVAGLLEGAREMDALTRERDVPKNPAALLALMWFHGAEGRGAKDMVVLPYKDRLLLFSRYLQQLVMESLGKERNLKGEVVHQGLSVYGNKGSTDQHAYVQQLRDGVPNFFATFIEVLADREVAADRPSDEAPPLEVEPGVTSGDYLQGFLLGTRRALAQSGRQSMTLTLPDVSARSLGALIALYERAVGLYAFLIGVNAYDQPGVEAGKKAAAQVLSLQLRLVEALRAKSEPQSAEAIAEAIGAPEEAETAFQVLLHLSANPGRGVKREGRAVPQEARFRSA